MSTNIFCLFLNYQTSNTIVHRLRIIILLSIFTFIGCEEDYILHRGDFKPSIVVNSIFTVNKPWVVNLTFSRDILVSGSSIQTVNNAKVFVVEKSNGRIILLENKGNGLYRSDIFPPEADKTYVLNVLVDGYKNITASSISPKNASVVNIVSGEFDQDGEKKTKVDFEIKDITNNYYIWNLIIDNKLNQQDTNFSGNPKDLVQSIKKYNDLSGYIYDNSNPIRNDAVSQGGSFSTYNQNNNLDGSGSSSGNGSNAVKKKYLRLLTVSKDLYSYYKTVEKFTSAENHNSSFSQTPDIYSNIQNGLGVFAGYTEKYIEVK